MPCKDLRIIVLIDRYWPILGGAQNNVHQIGVGLVERGFRLTVLTRMLVPELSKYELVSGVEVKRFSRSRYRVLSKLLCIYSIVRYLIKYRADYDAVLCVPCTKLTDLLPAYLSSLVTGKPYVIRTTSVSLYDSILGPKSGSWLQNLQSIFLPPFLWRRVLRRAETIVNQSEAVRVRGLKYDIDSNLVIANGVDTQLFHSPSDSRKRAIRNELGISERSLVLTNTARFVHEKNQIALLKVASGFLERGVDDFLVILLGATEEGQIADARPSLLAYIENEGLQDRVRIVDDAPNVSEYLQASDVFVFPTRHAEGMSNSLLEAMATGLPIVASAMDQLACIFPEGYPYFFEPTSGEDLLETLWRFVESPTLRERVGRELEVHIRNHYALTSSISRYEELFHKIEAA